MIRIAIVEDDKAVQTQLAEYIRRYERQFGRMFELSLFDDGDEIVSDYKAVYDIILLDVQMRRMDGMATAERIRQMDKDVLLIFITNMAQFAIRGYAVDALDYVYRAKTEEAVKGAERSSRPLTASFGFAISLPRWLLPILPVSGTSCTHQYRCTADTLCHKVFAYKSC